MTDTVFVDGNISQANRIVAAWLNDVNNLRYLGGSSSRGAALMSYLRAGGTIPRTQAAVNGDSISSREFCAGDGVTPDDDGWDAAVAAANGKTLWVFDTPLFTRKHTINTSIRLIFDGYCNVDTPFPNAVGGSHIVKAASMTDTALVIDGGSGLQDRISFEAFGGGVVGKAGNTGDGVQLTAWGAVWHGLMVTRCGTNGIRVGRTPSAGNSSQIKLYQPFCGSNGNSGIVVFDTSDNANDITIVGPVCTGNGNHGINAVGPGGNLIVLNMHCESNTGNGLRDDGTSRNVYIGGDCEGNTAGDVLVTSATSGAALINLGCVTIVDQSPSTIIVNSDNSLGDILLPRPRVKPSTLVLANGANQNVALPNTGFVAITGPTGAFSLGGLVPPTSFKAGYTAILENTVNQNFTVSHAAAGSAAANRIYCKGGADIVVAQYGLVTLIRDQDVVGGWVVQAIS